MKVDEVSILRREMKRLADNNHRLESALEAWQAYAHKALDAGYIKSMPGNEIPWRAHERKAKEKK